MTVRGVELAVTALQARLASQLPTEISTINAANPDLVVDPPMSVLEYVPAIGERTQFPLVFIEHGPGKLEDDTAFDATGVYDLIVVAMVQHSDQQSLAKLVRRYHLAILRAVPRGTTIGTQPGAIWGTVVRGFDFGPAFTQRDNSGGPPYDYLTWVAVAYTVRLDEN